MEIITGKNEWIDRVRGAYDESTKYIDNNYRRQWDDAIKHFNSKHTSDSKYAKNEYKYRSKIFRPKTRAAIRGNEAAAAAAFFGTQDVVSCEAWDPTDKIAVAGAAVKHQLLNYRLQETIPWFLTCLGGIQDAQKVGVVCSYQYWDFKELKFPDGTTKTICDEPRIELLPVENIRIHPASSWINPINSSPYLIRMVPMYMMDVLIKMESINIKTGEPKWNKHTREEVSSATLTLFDTTKDAMRDGREDPYEEQRKEPVLEDYGIVWCLENFMRVEGIDVVFWTVGTELMLTDPIPINEIYWHGERPVVMGYSVIDTHKIFPPGLATLALPIQKEINENVNQRLDNVKFILNKRFLVNRGANVDVISLVRNVPGSATFVDNTQTDVQPLEFQDVTGTSYMEQDRLSLDFDDVWGAFSASTIQSNRRMNETVGGMAMLRGGANSMTELGLRIIAETWIEPVLKQLVKMEQYYETDEEVLALAGERAELPQKFGVRFIDENLLGQKTVTRVNVGMGATDPVMKIQNFMLGINTYLQVLTQAPPGSFNLEEIAKEVFGRLGYKDGSRFIKSEEGVDPEKAQLKGMIQQLQGALNELQMKLQNKEGEQRTKLIATEMKEDGQDRRKALDSETKLREKQMELQAARARGRNED